MRCEVCKKECDAVINYNGKDMCGTCHRTILESQKPKNPKKDDKREYIEK